MYFFMSVLTYTPVYCLFFICIHELKTWERRRRERESSVRVRERVSILNSSNRIKVYLCRGFIFTFFFCHKSSLLLFELWTEVFKLGVRGSLIKENLMKEVFSFSKLWIIELHCGVRWNEHFGTWRFGVQLYTLE